MTYSYRIHYTSPQVTELNGCDKQIDLKEALRDGYIHVTTPSGHTLINIRNVTSIEEIIRK